MTSSFYFLVFVHVEGAVVFRRPNVQDAELSGVLRELCRDYPRGLVGCQRQM